MGVSISTILNHLKKIGLVKKLNKLVQHFEVCSMLFLQNLNDPFQDRIVTYDKKWILYDNHKQSTQWLDQDKAHKHFPKPKLCELKIMVTFWWSSIGIVHSSFLESNQGIIVEVYSQQLDEMNVYLSKMHLALVYQLGPVLLHNNTPPHIARMTPQKITDLG